MGYAARWVSRRFYPIIGRYLILRIAEGVRPRWIPMIV